MTTPLRSTTEELRLSPQNPWPGLPAFTAANSQFFFGRETEIAEIFRRVRRQMLTVLFGVSGLGKTSLLQAGLLPKLGGSPFHPVMIRLDHAPEAEDLIEQVRTTILRAVEAATRSGSVQIPRGPEKGEDLWGYFHDKALDWHNDRGEVVHAVLVFDQFEEIFTRETRSRLLEERKQRFIEVLACLVENRPPEALARKVEADQELSRRYDFRQDDYRVVISLREDFLPHLESLKRHMPSIMENRMRLTRMDREQALQAVIGPGREIVEESVAREIVAFVAGRAREGLATVTDGEEAEDAVASSAVDPALLSLVCDELNRRRLDRKQPRITADLLTEEREGIIKGFYERAFEGVEARVREWVEDELLTASGYRDRAAVEDALRLGLPGGALDQLVDRRVLHREEREGVIWLELTHDLLTGPAAQSRSAREQRIQAEAAAARERELERERDAQRRKARRMAWLSRSLAAALVGLMALAWWYWDGHLRIQTEYYITFTKRWGIAQGVGRLTEEQASHRPCSFRFVYKGRRGQLIRLQAVDALGRLTPRHEVGTVLKNASEDENPERECQWEFVRDAQGQVVYEIALNRDMKLVWGYVYSPPTTNKFLRRGHFVDPSGMPLAMRNSSAEYIAIAYDRSGFETNVLYQDHQGNPQSGPYGAYGEVRQFDSRGLAIRKTSQDSARQPMVDSAGNSTQDLEYDERGLLVRSRASVLADWTAPPRWVVWKYGYHEIRFRYNEDGLAVEENLFDLDGKPVLGKGGFARQTKGYDVRGNLVKLEYFDTQGKPTLYQGNYHRLEHEYDERGNRTNAVLFDTTGRRTVMSNGSGQIVSRFNERDLEVERAYLDAAGKATSVGEGYARMTRRYDERSRVIEESYFDEAGRPRGGAGRYARKQLTYDERGNLSGEAFFDAAGRPMAGKQEYARLAAKYDGRNNRIEEAYFDELGLPVRHQNGYARLERRYDSRGNVEEEINYDENGSLVKLAEGYSRRVMLYNERNHKKEEAYFDEQNRPVRQKDGVAKKLFRYDDHGNLVEESYRSESDQPLNSSGGYARQTAVYDEHDNWIEWRFFDQNGSPRAPAKGNALSRARYDERRRQLEVAYYDDAEQLRMWSGYARKTWAHDERGNQTEEHYFDANGHPAAEREFKAYGWRKGFDQRGNWTNWVYLDAAGQPMMTASNYAARALMYDARGNLLEQGWFDEHLKPLNQSEGYAKITYRYDAQDNEIERAFFDAENQPVQAGGGYARLTSQYNEHGRRTERAFWDERGQLVAGVAKTISHYDARENETDFGFFNAANRPILSPALGWHKWVKTFDTFGRWTNLAYLDIQGGLVDGKEGFARQIAVYNKRGLLTELAWFDAAGNLARNGTNSYARMSAAYDEQGNQIRRAYFTPTNSPARGPNGYAGYTARFNQQGRVLETTYFYDPGHPNRKQNRYAKATISYDERGNQIRWACFDEKNQPVPDLSDGIHMLEFSYDELGRVISRAQLGTSGQLLMNSNGYARVETKYDQAGNVAEKVYLDENNDPVHTKEYYAREVLTYDSRGRKTEVRRYYAPQSPVLIANGYAQVKLTFDDRGNTVEWECFDTNGAATVDLEAGNHAFRRQYDERGYYTNQINLDVAGRWVVNSNGFARLEVRRDAQGREVEQLYFDEHNEPMHSGTFAYRRLDRYHSSGKTAENTYFYATNSPAFLEDGYAMGRISYDTRGNATNYLYLDGSGHPVMTSSGYARFTQVFDEHNERVRRDYFDADDRPVVFRPIIQEVVAGGQGEQLGLKPGDVILSYGGQNATSTEQVVKLVKAPGTEMRELKIRRAGRILALQARPGLLGMILKDGAEAYSEPGNAP